MRRAEPSQGFGIVIRDRKEGKSSDVIKSQNGNDTCLPTLTASAPGLDDALQDYPFEDWELPGKYLLQLCPQSLEALTVWPLGHQELILDGVEQLRALVSEHCPRWL